MPLPVPRTWSDGEEPTNIPTADDLNLDWRDSFKFLLGTDRPIILVNSTVASGVGVGGTNIQWNNQRLLRGGMVHSTSTNNHLITVPYTGQYQGYVMSGYASTTVTSTRLVCRLFKNPASPVNFARTEDVPQRTTGWSVTFSFTADLAANDQIYLVNTATSGSATMGSDTVYNSKLGMWYVGDST